jgi:hypothetical protein
MTLINGTQEALTQRLTSPNHARPRDQLLFHSSSGALFALLLILSITLYLARLLTAHSIDICQIARFVKRTVKAEKTPKRTVALGFVSFQLIQQIRLTDSIPI